MEGDSRNPRVSLLKKYDIPVDHLSYEHIGQCSNKKELERIVRILRSGEEGIFPDLIKFAEEKLRKLSPNSRALRVEAPIMTKDSLPEEEWKEVENDLLSWENEMKVMDKSLEFEKKRFDVIGNKNLPEIRKVEPVKPKVDKTKVKIETNNKNNRIKSGDYSSWDKFDVDKELLKLDLEEERKAEEIAKTKRELEKKKKEEKNIEIVKPEAVVVNCTNTEQLVLANQAKDRGNECFKSGDLNNALKYYGVSIKLCPTANAYNNRAMTYLKLKNYENALSDCNEVLKLEPNNVKALHRRATSYRNLPGKGNDELALKDLNRIISLEPNNKVAQTDLQALKKKLKIEDHGRRFRMAIQETNDSAQAGKKFVDPYFPGSNIPVDKLPLTYYGPSTSTFECEPHSMAHKILLGPSWTGRIMCKCNSSTPRQNPLCQRCGELMSKPKPTVKKPSVQTENVKDKMGNNKKNELLKQNEKKAELPKEAKTELPKEAKTALPKEAKAEVKTVQDNTSDTKNKDEVNTCNEKSKSNQKTEDVKKPNAKFKEDWEDFINSKFSNSNKAKSKFVNNSIDDGKTAFITEIFDDEDLGNDNEELEEEKMKKDVANDSSKNKKEEKNIEIECKRSSVDDKETNGKLQEFEEKIPELEEKMPKSEEKMPELEEKMPKLEDEIPELEEKVPEFEEKVPELNEKVSESEEKLLEPEENLQESEEKHLPEPEEKLFEMQEKSPHTADSSDNQSLPSTSSQLESRKVRLKRKKKGFNPREREYKYSYPEPVKVQQASKYLKPTSVEPKNQNESTEEIHHEIKTDSDVQFKNFVPNRKCLSTEDVLKANRNANIIRDNRFESMNGDGDKIQNEINEEGNKENIKKCNEGGGEEVRVARKISSAYEFIKEWESLKKSDETYVKRAEIMKLLTPCDLVKVIGNKLDSEILKSMLECLDRHFIETDPNTTVEFLKQLVNVPRFGIVKLFMDSYEKKIIERLLDSAEKKGCTLDQEVKKQLMSG